MLKQILSILILMVIQLTDGFCGANYRLLDDKASTFEHRILSRIDSSQSMISESLVFVYDLDKLNEKYKQTESFGKFYSEIATKIPQEEFLKFAANCKSIYEQNSDPKTKAAAYMLLEKVSGKVQDFLELYNKKLKQKPVPPMDPAEAQQLMNSLQNADKG